MLVQLANLLSGEQQPSTTDELVLDSSIRDWVLDPDSRSLWPPFLYLCVHKPVPVMPPVVCMYLHVRSSLVQPRETRGNLSNNMTIFEKRMALIEWIPRLDADAYGIQIKFGNYGRYICVMSMMSSRPARVLRAHLLSCYWPAMCECSVRHFSISSPPSPSSPPLSVCLLLFVFFVCLPPPAPRGPRMTPLLAPRLWFVRAQRGRDMHGVADIWPDGQTEGVWFGVWGGLAAGLIIRIIYDIRKSVYTVINMACKRETCVRSENKSSFMLYDMW